MRGIDLEPVILKAAVEREKAVQAIAAPRECKNCVVTFWVMSQFLDFLGASRNCADFRDPTAVFRVIDQHVRKKPHSKKTRNGSFLNIFARSPAEYF
jgi:hypothetical protein